MWIGQKWTDSGPRLRCGHENGASLREKDRVLHPPSGRREVNMASAFQSS